MKNANQNQKRVLGVASFTLIMVFALAVMMESGTIQLTNQQQFSSQLPVEYSSFGEISTNESKLRAIVKGSIYETGSNMTVFGACFDGDGVLFPPAETFFTSWYPNGTIHVGPDEPMFGVYEDSDGFHPNGTGRWGIHVTMGDTIGTYLTEMRCEYDGDFAIAFGEWQNPEWVVRIRETQEQLNETYEFLGNVSTNLINFENFTTQQFASLSAMFSNISVQSEEQVEESVRQLQSALRDIDVARWTLDTKNPFYQLGSGTHNWQVVDMLNEDMVVVASDDGYIAMWDGASWEYWYHEDYSWRGVSLMPAVMIYSWIVGSDGTNPYYSVNGAAPEQFIPDAGSPTYLNDVVVFQRPNFPAGQFYGYILGDDGSVYFSDDSANTWSFEFGMGMGGSGDRGRISQIVDNHDPGQQDGYLAMFGQGNSIVLTDGSSQDYFTVAGNVRAVSLYSNTLGYAVVKGATESYIYKYNGTNVTLDYTIEGSAITPTGIVVHSNNDIWVTTSDPSVLYHFDGRSWEYNAVGYGELISVIINFNSGSSASLGIQDVAMSSTRDGYAVGTDGIIMKYSSKYDMMFEQMFEALENLNYTEILDAIDQMNQSVTQDLADLQLTLDTFNQTASLQLDNILGNVTYTQFWLENTLEPYVTSILVQLGIIEAKVDQTIQLQNQTISIVNETSSDVKDLIAHNQRMKAWITP